MLATLSIINVMSVANAGHCSRFKNLMVTLDSNWITMIRIWITSQNFVL